MPSPGGKSVGRLSVRVVPDTSKLREDLKKVFKRLEATQQINIQVAADTTRAVRDVNKFMNSVDGKNVDLDVGVDDALSKARIAELTRNRKVSLIPEVSKTAAARALTALAALSGGRAVALRLQSIGAAVAGLDKSLPKFTAIAFATANLASVLLASTSGLTGVAAGLVSIAGAGAALPGIFAGMAAGAVIMFVALKDAKTQLAVLAPAFTKLQQVISADFWAKARKPIIELTRSLLPQLRAGSQAVATSLGSWTASLAAGLKLAFDGGQLAAMFGLLAKSVTIAATGTGALASIVSTLGSVGAQYLPRLAQGFVDVTTKFDDFLTMADGDGRLQKWIDTGIAAGQQLIGVLVNVAQIIGGVARAALAAGGGGLAALNHGLGAIAQIVSGPVFQGALITLFTGAALAVQSLATALGPIGNLLVSLAPTLSSVLATAGSTVASVLTGISAALSQPAVAAGINALINGLAAGLIALLPALGPVAQVIGVLATVAGTLGTTLGTVLTTALQALAPPLITILKAVQPLIPVLGNLLVSAIHLAPSLGGIVVPLLAAVAAWKIYAAVTKIVAIAQLALDAIMVANPIGLIVTAVAALVAGLVWFFTQTKLGKQIVTNVWAAVQKAVAAVVDWWQNTAEPALVGLWAAIQTAAAPVIAWLGTYVVPLIQAYGALIVAEFQLIGNIVSWLWTNIFKPTIDLIVDYWKFFWNTVQAVWSVVGPPLITLITDSWAVLSAVLGGVWDAMRIVFEGAWTAIRIVVETVLQVITGLIRTATSIIQGDWSGAWNNLKDVFATIWAGILSLVQINLDTIGALFSSVKTTIGNVFSDASTWLVDVGKAIIRGLADGIKAAAAVPVDAIKSILQTVSDYLPHSPAKVGPFSGRGWSRYSGQAIGKGLAQGLEESTPIARKAALGLMAELANRDSSPALAAVAAYSPSGSAGSVAGAGVAFSGNNFYSYDPSTLAAEVQKKQRDAQAVARLRSLVRG